MRVWVPTTFCVRSRSWPWRSTVDDGVSAISEFGTPPWYRFVLECVVGWSRRLTATIRAAPGAHLMLSIGFDAIGVAEPIAARLAFNEWVGGEISTAAHLRSAPFAKGTAFPVSDRACVWAEEMFAIKALDRTIVDGFVT